jgi:hypothetical protein
VLRLPETSPIIAEEIEHLRDTKIMALPAEDVARIRAAVEEIRAAAAPPVIEIMEPGVQALEAAVADQPVPGEVDREHVYSLGWMLFSVTRLRKDLEALRDRAWDGTEKLATVGGALAAADGLRLIVLRLLG